MPTKVQKNKSSQGADSAIQATTDATIPTSDEEKIQKERYKVFIEDVADGFYEVDLQGNFTFFNDAMCRWHQWHPVFSLRNRIL